MRPLLANPRKSKPAEVVIRTAARPASSGQKGGRSIACAMSPATHAAFMKKASALLATGISGGFGHFPIDRAALQSSMESTLLTRGAICAAVSRGSGATRANHNGMRKHYREGSLDEAAAQNVGMIARRIQVGAKCPAGYDFKRSGYYNDVDNCGEVTSKISAGVPASVYSLPMPPSRAMSYVNHPSAATLYTRYANAGPIACDGSTLTSGDSYHALYVSPVWADLDFIMHVDNGSDYTTWTLRRACSIKGKSYSYDDLIFNFGMRIYVPIEVDWDGKRFTHTIVVSAVAAASNSWAAGLLPSDLPYHRWIAGEFAKKLLVESWYRGWPVR